MDIAWDPNKATQNQSKHRVDFADAAMVFDDVYFVTQEEHERRLIMPDIEPSESEDIRVVPQ